jgi:hypothetical protein
MSQYWTFTHGLRNACITVVIGLVLVAAPEDSQAVEQSSAPAATRALERQLDVHDQAALTDTDPVDRQLAQYARRVPEMGIVRLYGDQAADFIRRLPGLLGEGAVNMDYEHDASMRNSLLELQMNRIGVMIRAGLPSATLFKTGEGSVFEHPYLCVISLDPGPFRQDPYYATWFLTSDYDRVYPVSTEKVLIKNADFLKFTVDHEMFHCLDAYFNGPPIKKTHDAIYSHYQTYVNEARADAFASQRFKREVAEPDRFLTTFAALRTLSLLALDLGHFTGDVIRHSMNVPPLSAPRNLEQQVAACRELVSGVAPSASRYGTRMASAVRLIGQLGGDPNGLLLEFEGQKLPPHDESQVTALLHEVRQAQRILEGNSVPRANVRDISLLP